MTYETFQKTFSISLNPQQTAAVRAEAGPVLLLAVPGSGKTTVLVTRLGYLLYCRGVRPEEILTMTYTVSATRDMRRRFAALFGEEYADALEFRTINGVCARVIRAYERTLSRTAFRLMTEESVLTGLVGELYRQVTGTFAAESDIRAVRTQITYVKNQMLSEEQIAAIQVDGVPFAPIYQAYCRLLREREWMDYDDQMVYALRILRQYPDLLDRLRRRYRYLCVDEAQDTSRIQHEIIRTLAGERPNLFLVGDEDQSIYGFRAAYPQALMEFAQVYPGARVLLMEQNYRSGGRIVAAADEFIRQNQTRHPKHMTAVRPEGLPVRQIWVANRKAQYAYLTTVARDCPTETAVLYRDNDSALPVIDALARLGIPYRCRQVESGFFSHAVVRDITDILRFAMDPTDGDRFLRIYYKLGAGIGKGAAVAAAEESRRSRRPILDLLAEREDLSAWTRIQVKALRTHLLHLLQEPADRAVYRIVQFMGYGAFLEERGADAGKVDILEALASREPSPARLLERLAELGDIVRGGSADPESRFLLSTIHSSKGLEYDRVFLMDAADGLLPKADPNSADPAERAALEEERRLFYVGMTRAREELAVFRFRDASITASFADALFPEARPTPPSRGVRPAPKPVERYHPPKDVSAQTENYSCGGRVIHRVFGHGTVVNRNGNIAILALDDGDVKRIDVAVALRQGALTLE